MKKSIIKAIICSIIAGIACIIAPNGSYNGEKIMIMQQPFNIAVFYLVFFIIQNDFHYEHSMFDIRCQTVLKSKFKRFFALSIVSVIYILLYIPISIVVSVIFSSDKNPIFISSFSLFIFFTSMLINLEILNIFSVNMDFIAKKSTITIIETLTVLGGLALCFSAPRLVPFICIWYYGVYPKPVIPISLAVSVYTVWAGIAIICGINNKNEILRKG